MHYSAEMGYVHIVDQLFLSGAAMTKSEHGLTPLLSAAERCQKEVVDNIIARPEVSIRDRIDALELLGGSLANDKENYNRDLAYECLHRAMKLRWSDPSAPVMKPQTLPLPAYDFRVECEGLEDLLAIRSDDHAIHMEGLMIRERILGAENAELGHSIVYRGAVFADCARFERCVQLWLHGLRLRRHVGASAWRDLLRFAQVFCQMLHVGVELDFESVREVMQTTVKEMEKNKQEQENKSEEHCSDSLSELGYNMHTLLYLVVIYSKIMSSLSENDRFSVMQILYDTVSLDPRTRENRRSLLHLAVDSKTRVDDFHTSSIVHFPSGAATRLLLEAGADATVMDADRNTPLHLIVAYPRIVSDFQTIHAVISALVDHGAHVDVVNQRALTPLQSATTGVAEIILKSQAKLSLMCLAAQAIKVHNISYKGQVPLALETFIELHGP